MENAPWRIGKKQLIIVQETTRGVKTLTDLVSDDRSQTSHNGAVGIQQIHYINSSSGGSMQTLGLVLKLEQAI